MGLILLIVVMILPIYVIGKVVYSIDKEKEPKVLLTEILFGGVLSCLFVVTLSYTLGEFIPLFFKDIDLMNKVELIIYSFICVGLIEEGCKFYLLYLTSYYSKDFNYSFDMIVYGVYTALGFALFENVFYILGGGLVTGIARAFTAVPAHASNGALMGMMLSRAKWYEVTKPKKSLAYKILAVLIPTLLHGVYDMFAFSNQITYLIGFLATLFTVTVILVKKKQKQDVSMNSYTIE